MTDNMLEKPEPGELALAVALNDVIAAEDLLQRGAEIGEKDDKMQSLLRIAVCSGFAEMAWLLIEQGANVNEKDWSGAPLLIEAVSRSYFDIAVLLLDNKADIDAVDGDNWTALHYCALNNNQMDMMHLLIRRNANPGILTKAGETAQDIAQRKYHYVLRDLLDKAPTAYRNYLATVTQKISHDISALNQLSMVAKAQPYTIRKRVQP